MSIIVNGQEVSPVETTLIQFLRSRKIDLETLIVELNGAIVPTQAYSQVVLQHGDTLELVALVGGG